MWQYSQMTIIQKAGSENAGLDDIFHALADPTRRAMVERLAQGDATVLELLRPFSLSQPTISKHLKVLEHAGLISRGRRGTRRPARLEPSALASANLWIEQHQRAWEENFQRLDQLLGAHPRPQDDE